MHRFRIALTTATAFLALVLALVSPAQARTPPGVTLAKAQEAWWTAQGKPSRVRWSSLEQRQLRRMSKIGPLSVDTFFKRVSVSKPDGKGGRWVYALDKRNGGDAMASRVHYGAQQQPLMIYAEQAFTAGRTRQVYKTWTFRQGAKQLPERFREAGQGLGPGRRDIVSIQHVFAGGKRNGTGISVVPGGREMVHPGIVDGAFYRVARRMTTAGR